MKPSYLRLFFKIHFHFFITFKASIRLENSSRLKTFKSRMTYETLVNENQSESFSLLEPTLHKNT